MSSLALYRTYRPGRFSELVGQDHVTEPLIRALENDRVHHAYLFSGPRGCGKTSSARILARSLNCEKGPTPEPCGECQSCTDLAPNGPGSIDVVELDAATHGLVDDARDLREKAHFAPVSSRYKIYIIDEAHQLGPGAANALLKLIEEPPPHLKFIFATTAPDKIIGTIRSRTYHYPFRLIPAKTLQQNLSWICEQEGVKIEPAALALVARAGAGSARDSQSVLGQLIAGAGSDGVTYELAIDLLGFTDASLLDEVVDGIAAGDSQAVFAALDRVMDSGHEPRRFLTDLLERFRDLVVVQAVPDAAAAGLITVPEDQADRMSAQAARLGPSDLVRLANVVDQGITDMKGATPTRLQLELVCARLLLPGADHSVSGVQARLDRLERRVAGGVAAPAQSAAPPSAQQEPQAASQPTSAPSAPAEEHLAPQDSEQEPPPAADRAAEVSKESPTQPKPRTPTTPEASPAPTAPPAKEATSTAAAGRTLADIRNMWADVLARLREIKLTPWSLISQNSVVADFNGDVLTLAFQQASLRDTFMRREDVQNSLRQAIQDVLLIEVKVDAIVDPSTDAASAQAGSGQRRTEPSRREPSQGAARARAAASTAQQQSKASAGNQTSIGAEGSGGDGDPDSGHDADHDADLGDNALDERDLLAKTLGATVIEEINHDE